MRDMGTYVPATTRALLSESGQITSAAITLYTEGDCWLLAFELGCLLNVPLVAVINPADPFDWLHVTADLGRETLLDVFGPRSREETIRYWSERLQEPVTLREMGYFYSLDDMLTVLDGMTVLGTLVTLADEQNARIVAAALAQRTTV